MPSWQLLLKPLSSPLQALITIFVAWKTLLLVVAVCSPGPDYDTSTSLYNGTVGIERENLLATVLRLVSRKLTRWDAIYFTKAANRGYLFEQEWAFGWGFTRLIEYFAKDLRSIGFDHYDFVESFVGITIAHASHGASVLVLYSLGRAVFPPRSGPKVGFIAACLHIFTPGGLFLSAPYAESTFALLVFLGCLCFVQSFPLAGNDKGHGNIYIIAAGVIFGLANIFRSNGLAYGILFLEEAIRLFFSLRGGLSLTIIWRLAATIIGGLCIAIGFVLPQYMAYRQLCGTPPALWCNRMFPSVYIYVQDKYWGVGFLRYWTVSNLPLFLLAGPMLTILIMSSLWALKLPTSVTSTAPPRSSKLAAAQMVRKVHLLRSLAIPQLLVAVMALTSYHVQIISRISSGYPLWYFWLAALLTESEDAVTPGKAKDSLSRSSFGGIPSVIRYMVMYAVIQGGLFASFLPPA